MTSPIIIALIVTLFCNFFELQAQMEAIFVTINSRQIPSKEFYLPDQVLKNISRTIFEKEEIILDHYCMAKQYAKKYSSGQHFSQKAFFQTVTEKLAKLTQKSQETKCPTSIGASEHDTLKVN